MSKFTPGPWNIMPSYHPNQTDFIFLHDGYTVMTMAQIGKIHNDEDVANMILISKAPDMYELLKTLVDTTSGLGTDNLVTEEFVNSVIELIKEINNGE